MKPAVVIGIGNPSCRDDGFGAAVLEALARRDLGPDVVLHRVHQLTPEDVDLCAGAARVALVDAAQDHPPGQLDVREVPAARLVDAHRFGPGQLRTLSEMLLDLAPVMRLFTVGGRSFDFGEEPSAIVRARVEATADAVLAWILSEGVPPRTP